MLDYDYKACETEKIVKMAINGRGVRDTVRFLKLIKIQLLVR